MHRNLPSFTRMKSNTGTSSKIDIVPQCCCLRETCVTERAIVDIVVEKTRLSSMSDSSSEDLKMKEIATGEQSGQNQISSSTETGSRRQLCSDKCTKKPKDNKRIDDNPVDSVKYLLRQLKIKLKGDFVLNEILDAVEKELRDLLSSWKFNHVQRSIKSNQEVRNTTNNACVRLEETCNLLERTCMNLKEERDYSNKLAIVKSDQLLESLEREVEATKLLYKSKSKLEELSVKLGKYSFSFESLNGYIEKHQNNTRELERLESQVMKLNYALKTLSEENRKLLTELETATIERDQLQSALNGTTYIIKDSSSGSSIAMVPLPRRSCSANLERTFSLWSDQIDSTEEEAQTRASSVLVWSTNALLLTRTNIDDLKLKVEQIFKEMDRLAIEALCERRSLVDTSNIHSAELLHNSEDSQLKD